jgi:DNA-binding Lrp family transcriptional regulator
MSEWTPKPKRDAATEDLNLTGEEGTVLSRIDGSTSLSRLAATTGLPEGRVRQILKKLVDHGAVEAAEAAPSPAHTAIDKAELRALLESNSDEGEPIGPEHPTVDDAAAVLEATEELTAPAPVAGDEVQLDAVSAPDGAAEAPAEEGEAEAKDGEETPEVEEGNYRQLYETVLSKLEAPAREALARTAKDAELMALCFDPLHSVIRGIFENQNAGPPHARLVARHHRTPQGLDVVMGRAEFLRDPQIQRLLLANPMLQDAQLKKLLQTKRLLDVYKVTTNRDIPERNRQKSRNIMRSKWATAEGEERAGLVLQTEGRVLTQLTGLPFDSQMTSLLCGKTYNSVLLIQNLARFGACPPQLLAHLLKQPAVRRQQHLKNLILQHPNCPSDAKRKM